MPRIRYNCSVSILHPATPQCQIPILWWFPGTCFLPPVFQLWIWCLFEFALSILYPDLTTDSSLALQLCPWVWLKSYARFLQILSSGWAVFQKGNNILPQASPWFFPTTQATLDSSSEPRPGIWPAWFSKDSALPGELHDKNELTLTLSEVHAWVRGLRSYWKYLQGALSFQPQTGIGDRRNVLISLL